MKSGASGRPITVYGAIVANFIIAVARFVAAAFTGSSAMLSEGIHSVADTGNQLLLLLGIQRGRVPPDDLHLLLEILRVRSEGQNLWQALQGGVASGGRHSAALRA